MKNRTLATLLTFLINLGATSAAAGNTTNLGIEPNFNKKTGERVIRLVKVNEVCLKQIGLRAGDLVSSIGAVKTQDVGSFLSGYEKWMHSQETSKIIFFRNGERVSLKGICKGEPR